LLSYRKEVVNEVFKDVVLDQFPGQRLPMPALVWCELLCLVLGMNVHLNACGIQDEEKRHLSTRALRESKR